MPKPIKILTDEQSKKLLNTILHTNKTDLQKHKGIRNYLMALLMLDAGLRVGELTKLKITDLWFADRPVQTLIIREEVAKLQHEREVPMTERLKIAVNMMHQYLWHLQPIDQRVYAFYNSNSKFPLCIRQVQRFLEIWSVEALGLKMNPHALRHTFATRLMRIAKPSVVQALLGHRHLSSTEIYMHPNTGDLSNAIGALNHSNETANEKTLENA